VEVDARRGQAGVSTVEVAIMLTVVLVFIMGLIELGNIVTTQLTIQKAAEQGARFATTGVGFAEGTRNTLITTEVNKILSSLTSGTSSVAICSWPHTGGNTWPTLSSQASCRASNAGSPCDMVQVQVTFTYNPITAFAVNPLGFLISGRTSIFSTITLTGRDKKVNEPWSPCGAGS
jgi:Flp pilus assembly protein TadG